MGTLKQGLMACLSDERDRWVLWLPVLFGTGIGVYFLLPVEPPAWIGASVLAAAVIFGRLAHRRPALLVLMIGLGAVSFGFMVIQMRTVQVSAPVLTDRLGVVSVTGRIVVAETLLRGRRVTLEQPTISRLKPAETPARIRIRLNGTQPDFRPGDWIMVRASLSPPPPPAAPGAFDFQRQSYFKRIGAVGFSLGQASILPSSGETGNMSSGLFIANLRQDISARIRRQLDGDAGALATALMTGDRGGITDQVMRNMRDSGLAHLLAISGLHIGLVAGILFFTFRAALALIPPLVLRYPIKKWAAAVSITGALFYALIAGATVPTQRAFLMIGLVLMAVLLDRQGLSMRMVAWAAAIILLLKPESLLGASFQLSFAAVAALIAAYEVITLYRRKRETGPSGWGRRFGWYLGGIAISTLVAGLATGPFAIYHFNRFADYSLAANILSVPLTALWIMPCAVAAFLLMPFGLEHLALTPMGWGIEALIGISKTIAGWPGAVTLVPAMPTGALAVIAVSGVWLIVWRRRWRLWGLAGILAGLAVIPFVRSPDILVDGGAKLLAVKTAEGGYVFSTLRAARFNRDIWLRRAGISVPPAPWTDLGKAKEARFRCDSLGCLYRASGRTATLVQQEGALLEDCWSSDVIVSLVPVRAPCPVPRRVIDRFDLWREGSHALWLNGNGVRIESVNEHRGDRPWVVRPRGRTGGKEK
ncbi:MAG: ComEC family competence protein [Rhodospirillales bacterium]|nr:ComEC family competence protein [Rhodospirillales bacterium]